MKDNIFLISSSSYRLMEEEINKIVKDKNYETYDLNIDELDNVLEEAAYMSLFDDEKIMLVKNANMFGTTKKKSEDEDAVSNKDKKLLDYLNNPNSNTKIIFTINGKANGTKKITKLIKEKYTYIEYADLKLKDVYEKIEKLLKSKRFKLDRDTIYYIINSLQNNYDLVYNEIEKIELYYGNNKNVIFNDIENIISHSIMDNNFKFVDSVIKKNVVNSFKYYDDLMIQKVEPIMLLGMLAKEFRNMLLVKKSLNSSKKGLMDLTGLKFEFQIDNVINNCYSFKEKELEDLLIYLCDLDHNIKIGKVSNKLALQLFILKCAI